jgi:hypothetical protein
VNPAGYTSSSGEEGISGKLPTDSTPNWDPMADSPTAIVLTNDEQDEAGKSRKLVIEDVKQSSSGIWYAVYQDGKGTVLGATSNGGLGDQVKAYETIARKIESAVGVSNPALSAGMNESILATMVTEATSGTKAFIEPAKRALAADIAQITAGCKNPTTPEAKIACDAKLSKLRAALTSLQDSSLGLSQAGGSRKRRTQRKGRAEKGRKYRKARSIKGRSIKGRKYRR